MPHHDTNALETVALLDDLVRLCRADHRGFRAAASRVDREEFAAALTDLADRRAESADQLEGTLRDLGGEPAAADVAAEEGWLAHEDVAAGDDEGILVACERNEEETAARFRDALESPNVPEEVREVLEESKADIDEARGRLQGLASVARNGA